MFGKTAGFAPAQHMDGNPHFERAQEALHVAELAEDGSAGELNALATAQAHATLALAFEQRSTTLAHLHAAKFGLIRSVQLIQDRLLGGLALK